MKTTYVLDTNVLLDDPRAFLAFKKNQVVLPYKVIEELDKHKNSAGEIGMAARDCSRQISTLFSGGSHKSLEAGIKLSSGGILKVISAGSFEKHEDLTLESGDDFILAVCVNLHWKKKSAEKVVLVSNDMLLRIRANSFGVETETYEANKKVENLDDLYSGFNPIAASDEVLSEYYSGAEKEMYFGLPTGDVIEKDLCPNEFVLLSKNVKTKPYPLLKYNGHNLCYVKEKQLTKIRAMNAEQAMTIELLTDPKVSLVTLTGPSGCGKTLLSVAAGLDQVLDEKTYKNLIIIRPVHAVGKEIGFLPGTLEEKMDPWMAPIKDNLRFLMSEKDDNGKKSKNSEKSLEYLFDRGIIEVDALTYIRGRSINNAFMIIDESQNLDQHELKAILTRVGYNTKIVLTGDIEQTDRRDVDSLSNGLAVAVEKFKPYGLSGHVTLKEGVRSELATLASKVL